jgi:hypothetical protein
MNGKSNCPRRWKRQACEQVKKSLRACKELNSESCLSCLNLRSKPKTFLFFLARTLGASVEALSSSVTAMPLDVRRRLRHAVGGSAHSGFAPGLGSALSTEEICLLISRHKGATSVHSIGQSPNQGRSPLRNSALTAWRSPASHQAA